MNRGGFSVNEARNLAWLNASLAKRVDPQALSCILLRFQASMSW